MRAIRRAQCVVRGALGAGLLAASAPYALPTTLYAQAQAQAQAQPVDTMAFYKALDLEAAGKYREAAPLFRSALHTSAGVNALLGLELAYAELGWSDSLLKPLDTLIASAPAEETYRTVQLRTLQSLGRETELRAAFERWTREQPSSSAPYREYARLLMEKNQIVAADSILGRAKQSLGTTKDLQL